MDITLNAIQLKKCIEPCNALVGNLDKGFDLKYTNIQLIIKNKQLDLYATDTNISLHTEYGEISEEIQDIDVAVPADSFYIIFSDITNTEDVVTLSFGPKSLKVLYKKQQYVLSYFYNPEAIKEKVSIFDEPQAFQLFINSLYTQIEKDPYISLFTMDYMKLKQIFGNLVPCMSKSPADSNFYGIYYDGNFYASNRSSITGCYKVNNKYPEEAGEIKHVFFQNRTVQYVLKLSAQDECSLGLRGSIINLKVGNITILFTNNLVSYIPIEALKTFIEKNDKKYIVDTAEITPIIKKMTHYADTLNRGYGRITFKVDNILYIDVNNANKKSSFLEYISPCIDQLTPLEKETEIGIILSTVYSILQQIDSNQTTIYYNSKTTLPLIFINDDATQYYYISPTKISTKE